MIQVKKKQISSTERQNLITIEYRTFMGKGDRLTLQDSTPIQQLTNIIGKNLGQNPQNLELYNLGRFLKCRQKTLLQYGVKSNSIVHVSVVFQQFKKMHHQLIEKRSRRSSFASSLNPKYASIIIKIADTKINLSISILQSVQALKDKIQKISTFEAANILLFYDEIQLKNYSTLQECGITSFAVLRGELISEIAHGDSRQFNIEANHCEKNQSIKSGSDINVFDKSNVQSQEQQQMYYFMRDSLKEDHEDIKDFMQNIKLSQSVDVYSSNADIEIPYIYEGVDTNNNLKQVKKFQSLSSVEFQKVNFLAVSQTFTNQKRRSIEIRQQKWIGPCQIIVQNQAKTFIFTVFVNNSEHKFQQMQTFLQQRFKIKKIVFINPYKNQRISEDIFLYAIPWQSIILNGVLRINMLFSTQQTKN